MIIFLPDISKTQTQLNWVRRFGRSTWDIPYIVKPDNIGNIYVTGFLGLTDNDGKCPLIKYNLAGDSVWTRIYSAKDSLNTAGSQLFLDDSLNIYLSGRVLLKYNPSGDLIYARYYNCSTRRMNIDRKNNNNFIYAGYNLEGNGVELSLLKCNRNGDSLWKKVYPEFRFYSLNGLAVDRNNNIIVVGAISTPATDLDFVTIKFDSLGNFLWKNAYDGGDPTAGIDEARKVLLDSMDNIIVTGRSNGPSGATNYFTVKYDPTGNVIWESRLPDVASGSYDMKMDRSDNIYICGITNNSKYSTFKYNSNGQLLWRQTVNGGSISNSSLTLDSAGNVYMACNLNNSQNFSQYQVVKYSNNGNLLWNFVYSGNPIYHYFTTDIAVDNWGNVFVTGEAQFTQSSYDFVTLRIDQITGIIQNFSEIPNDFSLSQNYPNPFNPITKISYSLKKSANIELKLFDADGKLVRILERGNKQAGNYSINLTSESLATGIYYYSLYADGIVIDTKKAVVLK